MSWDDFFIITDILLYGNTLKWENKHKNGKENLSEYIKNNNNIFA